MTPAGNGSFYAPEIQTMPRAERARLQDERLAEVSRRAYDVPIPFVRRRLEAAGIGPGELSLENLHRVAIVRKADVRASEAACPPFGDYRGAPLEQCVRIAQTSGTSGRPTIVLWTRRDLEVEYDAYARNQWRQGYRPGETILVTAHPGYLNGGEPMVRGAAEAYGILCISIGPPTDDAQIQAALRLCALIKPNRYVLLGPAHQRLYEAAIANGYNPEADLGLPPPAEQVTFQWQQVSAGQEAFAYLGTECSEHAGAHVNEDYAVVEVLDPETHAPVPPGTRGHLVITTLARDNVVVRHDTEDLVRCVEDLCPCGETTRRLYWDGRHQDAVKVGDTTEILPIDVALVLADDPGLGQPAPRFQLVRRAARRDVLLVRAEGHGDPAGARGALEERLGVPVELEVVPPGALPRVAYKPVPVVDEP